MRIAQISPLFESVPPKLYGGTERVVSYLTEELVRLGHEVTLFASGDSVTKARLISQCPRSLRLDSKVVDSEVYQIVVSEQILRLSEEFDILHNHNDYFFYPTARRCAVPSLTTLHGRLDISDLVSLYREFHEMNVISISHSQQTALPWLNWQGVVYHGLPSHLFRFHQGPGNYLAYLGRISPEKRPDRAIEIAIEAGLPLLLAAKVDKKDQEYFDSVIKPMLKHPLIEYVGEITQAQKDDFLGNAKALLFPIDWCEPFGLVMIEAIACGTPVIAWPCGSVPEVLESGVSGMLCRTIAEAVQAVKKIEQMDRRRCRQAFETRFTAERMANDYLTIYQRLLEEKSELASLLR